MVSVILLDSENNPLKTIKHAANLFIVERAYSHAIGEFSLTIRDRRQNNTMQRARVLLVFGGGLNRIMSIDHISLDNTANFSKVTFQLSGIERVLEQRNDGNKELTWDNLSPLEVSGDIVERLQNGSLERRFIQFDNEVNIVGTLAYKEAHQMSEINHWEYIVQLMSAHKFCCDALTTGLGVVKLQFRLPDDREDVILSELSRYTKLNYVHTDYTIIRNSIIVAGEGEGVRQKIATYDAGEIGIDRFEAFSSEESLGSNEGYISNAKYYEMLTSAAKQLVNEKKQESDYTVSEALFRKVKTGDTIYVSSMAVNDGLLQSKIINELKTEIINGSTRRSITFF